MTGNNGRIDLLGKPRAEAAYTRVAFERETGPFIAVKPVYQKENLQLTGWALSKALESWSWRGCAGVKAVTCLDNGGDRCAVFEGFMDFLSYLQYAREHPGLPPMNFCILNSTAMAGRAGEFLSRHRLVHAFLDNDKAGMDALEKLEGNLGKDTVLVNESVRLYPRHNDFNEFLQACKKKAMTAGNEM